MCAGPRAPFLCVPLLNLARRVVLYGLLAAAAVAFTLPLNPPGLGRAHTLDLGAEFPPGRIDQDSYLWLTVQEGPSPWAARLLPDWSVRQDRRSGDAYMRESSIVAFAVVQSIIGREQPRALIVLDPVSERASELVRPGDTVTHLNGQRVDTLASFRELVASSAGRVELSLNRSGRTLRQSVELVGKPGSFHVGYLMAESFAPPPWSPVTGVTQGSSAGLLFALAYADTHFDGDLSGARVIAATGSITPSGAVMPVSGISGKVQAARDSGAAVLFVPQENRDEALKAAEGRILVVPVDTVEEALAFLCVRASDGFCRTAGLAAPAHS